MASVSSAGLGLRSTASTSTIHSRPSAAADRCRPAPRRPAAPPARLPQRAGRGGDGPPPRPRRSRRPAAAPGGTSSVITRRSAATAHQPPSSHLVARDQARRGERGPEELGLGELHAGEDRRGHRAGAADTIAGSSAVLTVRRMLERSRSAGPSSGARSPASPSRNSTASPTPFRSRVAPGDGVGLGVVLDADRAGGAELHRGDREDPAAAAEIQHPVTGAEVALEQRQRRAGRAVLAAAEGGLGIEHHASARRPPAGRPTRARR